LFCVSVRFKIGIYAEEGRGERKEGKQMEDGGNGAKGRGHGRGMKINEKKENITPTWRPRLLAEYPINDHDRLRSGDAVQIHRVAIPAFTRGQSSGIKCKQGE
jgi:hypothetical protein